MTGRWWALSGRYQVVLIVAVVAALILGANYWNQTRALEVALIEQESLRLRERLNLEQTQLDLRTAADNRMALRQQISSLALYTGLHHAFLIDEAGTVRVSLGRSDIGQTLDQVLQTDPELADVPRTLMQTPLSAIDIQLVLSRENPMLMGQVPVQDGSRLLVLVDLARSRNHRMVALERAFTRDAVVLMAVLLALTMVLHLIWFRRGQRLARVLDAIGEGQLHLRTGLTGHDELAMIGRAADRMAQRLQDDQQNLRHMHELINRSPGVVIEWRPRAGWPVVNVSDSVAQWGYQPADLLDNRLPYLQLIHPDDLPRVQEEVARHTREMHEVFVQEYRIRCADGRWAWLEDRTRFDRDERGRVVRITGVLMDITDRHEAQRAQAEQAEQMRRFFELPFIGMAISDPVSKCWVQVNDRLCEILGYPRDELEGASWASMTHPDDLGANLHHLDEVMSGQRDGYQMAKRFVRKDGAVVEVEMDVRAVREADGSLKHMFTTVQDVTERNRAQETIARSEARLRDAQRIARMGHWELDVGTGKGHWSAETFRLYGFPVTAPPPTLERAMAMVHPQDKARILAGLDQVRVAGREFEADYRISLASGELRHLHVRAEPVQQDGRVVRLVGTVQDVTDLVQAREERDRLAMVLENTADVVCMTDVDGIVFYLNRAAREFWSIDEGELPDGVLQRAHPVAVARRIAQEAIPTAIREGSWTGETPTLDAHGFEVPMSQLITAHRDDQGQVLYLSFIMRDIAELKQSAREIEERGQMLQQAEAIARLGSWTYDVQTGVVRWSPQMYINVGLPPSDRPPTVDGFCARVHPDDEPHLRAAVEQMMGGEDPPEVAFRTHPAHGPVRWLR